MTPLPFREVAEAATREVGRLDGPALRAAADRRARLRGAAAAGVAVVAAASAVAVFASSPVPGRVSPPAASESATPTRTVAWNDATFAIPATWMVREPEVSYGPVAFGPYLANTPLAGPCSTSPDGLTSHCGRPVERLAEGTFFAHWTSSTLGTFADAPGTPVEAGPGYVAKVHEQAPRKSCGDVGGTRAVDLYVQNVAAPERVFRLGACLRGPGDDALAAELRDVAASLRTG